MITKPGTTLYGIWDETAGGWLMNRRDNTIVLTSEPPKEDLVDMLACCFAPFDEYKTHTYTVRPFIVPAPGEMG